MHKGKALRALLLAAVLVPFGAGGAGSQSQDEVAKKLVGAWRYIGTWVDGQPRDRGPNPKGMIVYTAGGNMSVQIAPDRERKKAGAEATPDEAKAALTGYIAYFGTYTIDEAAQTVTHHRLGSVQPGDTADLVRKFKIEGDKLTLNTVDTNYFVYWERMK